ncbi:NAD(P)H-dependent oxidoreductase [Nocardia neocaledoniensis]|uniref:NAD(P)H-dependent oxidoreductase n=1 Tax=Nocardia neocaledoniensis TaxID=236511 RepID=UPI002458D056|nr:NAD(P)H-dependent oxidoreductase [Nocardia neocaledoniensis]
MRVLWVLAHPEPRSLTAQLRTAGIAALRAAGHEVIESDLYAMHWNPVVTAADFAEDGVGRLDVANDSESALRTGRLAADIRAEHEKLAWADTVVLHFPLWWYGMPAIMKGWLDRVMVQGYAYGVRDPESGRTRRYGDGGLAGRRATAVVSVGAHAGLGPRGIHGDLTEVLFALLHGTFFYTGMEVVEPVIIPGTNRVSDERFATIAADLRTRLLALPTTPAIPYRHQDSGDYDADWNLRQTHLPGATGLRIHRDDDESPWAATAC